MEKRLSHREQLLCGDRLVMRELARSHVYARGRGDYEHLRVLCQLQ